MNVQASNARPPGSASSLARGAAWGAGSQVATVIVQFGYAAVTARLLGPPEFGAYAVALSSLGVFGIVATTGLGQSSMLAESVDRRSVNALLGLAVCLGGFAAVLSVVTAKPWALIWGVPAAENIIYMATPILVLTPCWVVLSGTLRRVGNFRALAIIFWSGSTLGMIAGGYVAFATGEASALVVAQLATQLFVIPGALFALNSTFWPSFRTSAVRRHRSFLGGMLIYGLLAYLGRSIPRFGVSRILGASEYGIWNRSDALSSAQLQSVETILIQVIYPEFRDSDRRRTRRVWVDMLVLIAWLGTAAGSVTAVMVPPMIPLLLGPGWEGVVSLLPVLAFAGGVQMVSSLLTSALQATVSRKHSQRVELTVVALSVVGVGALVLVPNLQLAGSLLTILTMVRFGLDVRYASRRNLIHARPLLARWAWLTLTGGISVGAGLCVVTVLPAASGASAIIASVVGGFTTIAVLLVGAAVSGAGNPFRIARVYGIAKVRRG